MIIQEIINYIQANLKETITLDKLATLACLSPRHFSRKFKLQTKMSPNQYVIRCRVETAELLLLHTDIPIANIANIVGFHSQSHLNRHFKRILKVTPQTLRENKQETPKNKKVVHKDSWKRLTNYIWIFFPKSLFQGRSNHDFDLEQKIREELPNNELNLISELISILVLNYVIYFIYEQDVKNPQFNLTESLKESGSNNLDNTEIIIKKSRNLNSSISPAKNLNYVQNVEEELLGSYVGYEHSKISAILFNLKEKITMTMNSVFVLKNKLGVNIDNSLDNDKSNLSSIKKQFISQISDGKMSLNSVKDSLKDEMIPREFSSIDIVKEELLANIFEGEVFSPNIVKEGLFDKISQREFSADLIPERLQEKIAHGELPFPFTDEFQQERNLGRFVDYFTGEGLSKGFDTFASVDFEIPFDSFSPGKLFPEVGLPHSQLSQLDIYSPKDGSNFDLIEFSNFQLPKPRYGIASELDMPKNIELGDFNFSAELPFLNNFMLDEVAKPTD